MIRFQHISKYYGQRAILTDESFHFPQGERVALVGDNGAGKTTLLNILSGIETPDGGDLIQPKDLVVGFLPQEPNPNPEDTVLMECESSAKKIVQLRHRLDQLVLTLETDHRPEVLQQYEETESTFRLAGGYELQSRAEKILQGLGFKEETWDKSPCDLSGGWRMRLELAKLFLQEPGFLILDEPTNHLDLPSLIWMERYLVQFPGTLVFVSHDRELINRLATSLLHLQGGRITHYVGNYDKFVALQALQIAQAESQFEQMEKKKAQLQTFVDRFGAKASKASQAQSKSRVIEKLDQEQATLRVGVTQKKMHLLLPTPPANDRIVLQIEGGQIGYAQPLCTPIEALIERGQKVAIVGANGVGKSTLLKTIGKKIPSLGGKFLLSQRSVIAYFAQEQLDVLNPDETVLENLLYQAPIGEPLARRILGSLLFQGGDVFKKVGILSGGEKSRVGLACVLAQQANLLLLDEPTNHLDMGSIERLAESLQAYTGTMLVVSHNRFFINALCSHLLIITGEGECVFFTGTMDEYEHYCEKEGRTSLFASDSNAEKKGKTVRATAQPVTSTVSAAQRKKELVKVEEQMQEWERKVQQLQREMESLDPSDYQALGAIQTTIQEARQKMTSLEQTWLEISTHLES